MDEIIGKFHSNHACMMKFHFSRQNRIPYIQPKVSQSHVALSEGLGHVGVIFRYQETPTLISVFKVAVPLSRTPCWVSSQCGCSTISAAGVGCTSNEADLSPDVAVFGFIK